MTTKRRVLVLLNSVADTAGGSLRAAVNIAEAMAANDVDVTFSSPVARRRTHRTIDLMHSEVERRLFPASRPMARFGGSVRQLWWLWRTVRSFDEVQTHSLFSLSAVYSILICRIRRVPVVLWPHGSLDPLDLRKHAWIKRTIGPLVTRRLLNQCSVLLFTATREANIAVTYGSRAPHEVVPLPVAPLSLATRDSAAWRSRHGIPSGCPLVLFLGRVDYKKRLPLLVESLAAMARTDARLVIVGEGPASEWSLVNETAQRLGVMHRIHRTGWLEGPDRVEAFTVASVFALLSDFENFGLAVVEALSIGCPAVISSGVFLAEDLEHAGAVVVVDRDAVTAAKALDMLIDDPGEASRMSERAQALVAREFAPASVAARLNEVSMRWARTSSR